MSVHGDQYLRAKFKYERKSFEYLKKMFDQTLKSNQPAQYINHRQPSPISTVRRQPATDLTLSFVDYNNNKKDPA